MNQYTDLSSCVPFTDFLNLNNYLFIYKTIFKKVDYFPLNFLKKYLYLKLIIDYWYIIPFPLHNIWKSQSLMKNENFSSNCDWITQKASKEDAHFGMKL